MKSKYNIAIIKAILAAVLYAISTPASKVFLKEIPPMMMASFLYLGAGVGMSLMGIIRHENRRREKEPNLTKKERPYTIAMVALDIAAPIFLMFGLKMTTAANASLLNNFEIVATALIALFIFKEKINKRLWFAIILITLSSIILSVKDANSFSFSIGSVLVLLACVCWGLENNCTRKISTKDPLQIVVIKGFGSGFGSLMLALAFGEQIRNVAYIPAVLILGFFAYGLSIYFYVYAQRELGAAKTSAFYAIAPFVGVMLSFLILGERPDIQFAIALLIMIAGTYFASTDRKTTKSSQSGFRSV
ncbi:MAG: DMT family transporter [Bacteroidales bacterium]|nr:DMT family transporter [Bacteroidales bacterium]